MSWIVDESQLGGLSADAASSGVNGFTGGQADIPRFADLTVDVLKRTFEQRENPIDPFLELNIAKMRTELTG